MPEPARPPRPGNRDHSIRAHDGRCAAWEWRVAPAIDDDDPSYYRWVLVDVRRLDMPSASKAQARLMAGAAHNPKFAKKVGVPQSVAQDFDTADQAAGNLGNGADLPERAPTFREHKQRRPYA